MVVRVKRIQRHLHRVKWKTCGQHFQVNGWVLMSSESYKTNLAFFLGLLQRFCRATFPDEQVRIVVEADTVDLPEIQMIGSEPMQRFLEHTQRQRLVAPMGTDLGHEEHAIAHARQTVAHPDFGLAAMVFPAIVEECNAAIHGLPDKAYRGVNVRRIAEMMAAEAQRRDLHVVATKLSQRNRITSVRHRVLP